MYTSPAKSPASGGLLREIAIYRALKLRDDYRATGIKPPTWKVDKVYGTLLASLPELDIFWPMWYDINRELQEKEVSE